MNARNEIVIDGKQVAIVTYERTPVAGDWVRWTAITFHPMTGEVYRVALGGKMSTVFVRSAIEDKSEG